MAEKLKVDHAIIFTGYDPRAREIIGGLDLLVLPSQTETFGRTLLEAMAVGTPIVATRVGGIPEVVIHEKSGLLVDYADEDEFVTAICRMLRDESLRSRCVKEGLHRVHTEFSLTAHIRAFEYIYDAI